MSDQRVRWGILGCADIATTALIPAVRETDHGEIHAVGSRSRDKVASFAAEYKIPNAYESYDAVLDDPQVDVVYIPLPNTLHAEWIIRSAEAGKHVFCEKPLTMTAAEAETAIDACKAADVVFAEAFVYLYHRQTKHVRRLLDEGAVGDARHTEARFHYSFGGSPTNIRLRPEVGGGAFFDVGCYVLSWTRFVMGEPPEAIAGIRIEDAATGVDATSIATLRFSGGRTANISSGIRMHGGQHASIYGSEGVLELSQPFHPKAGEAEVTLIRDGKSERQSIDVRNLPFTDAVNAFQRSVVTGEPLPVPAMQDALDQARTMDAWRTALAESRWVELGG